MTLYSIFEKPQGMAAKNRVPVVVPPVAVADRFSWFAALFPPVFALFNGLWLLLVFWVALVALLALLDRCKSLNEDTLLILDEYRLAILVAIERALGDGDRVAREPAECDLDELEEQLRARLQRAWGPE